LKVGCRIDVKAKLFRRQNGNKDDSHCLNIIFVAFNCAFCCWVDDCRREWMEILIMSKNSLECHGDKFADVIVCIYWRQVRRSDKYWCYSDLVRIYWKRYLHYIHQWHVRWKILCSDIWHHMDDGYFTKRYEFIWIVYLRKTFLPGHVWRKKRSADDILFGWILTYAEKLCHCDYCLLMLIDTILVQ